MLCEMRARLSKLQTHTVCVWTKSDTARVKYGGDMGDAGYMEIFINTELAQKPIDKCQFKQQYPTLLQNLNYYPNLHCYPNLNKNRLKLKVYLFTTKFRKLSKNVT